MNLNPQTFYLSVSGLGIGLGVSGGTSLLLLAFGAPFIIRKLKERKVQKMKENISTKIMVYYCSK